MSSNKEEDLGFEIPAAPRGSRAKIGVGVALVVGAAFAFGYVRRGKAQQDIPVPVAKKLVVEVLTPKVLSTDRALELPGTVRPLEETQVYARVPGYVRAWHADLGDKVTAGQVLVEIETPELAAELSQARAQLASARAAVAQATAQRDFSKSNSTRYTTLADQQLVSKSQVEETTAKAATDQATVAAAESNVTAMEANVRRLAEQLSFAKVTAPFAGTITTRDVERGSLVQVGGTVPMFTLAATDPVRIFIDVPQTVAPNVKPDTAAQITVREYGARTFEGKVARSAGALDDELHTMRTEVRVPNADGALMPGMYVQVALTLATPHQILEVPSTALFSDADGLRLAVVEAGNRIKLVKITIERDTGATLQIATGLTGKERIVKIAVPTLRDGDVVEVAEAPPAAGSGSAAPTTH